MMYCLQEMFEDAKEVIRSRKEKDSQYNGQNKYHKSTKHYKECYRLSHTNPTMSREGTRVLWNGKQFAPYL